MGVLGSVGRRSSLKAVSRSARAGYHAAMNWFRTAYQKLSYKLGFGDGQQGRRFKCPWWVDMTTYAIGHIDGQGACLEAKQAALN